MAITEALEEAYATAPLGEVVHWTIQIDHASFAEPIRAVRAVEDMDLPLTLGGTPVTFIAIPFTVVEGSEGPDGTKGFRLSVGNPSYMIPYLRAAAGSSAPFDITFRVYTSTDLTQPGDVLDGLILRQADLTVTDVEATIDAPQIDDQAFPLETYSAELYPTLQNAAL